MFDGLIRELKRLEQGVQVPIDLPLDADGYLDRRCPGTPCDFDFKVLFEDWVDKVSDDAAYCPSCGHQASAQAFDTPEQTTYIQDVALAEAQFRIDRGLRTSAAEFNRRQPRQSFVSIRLQVADVPRAVPISTVAAEAMTLRVSCEACGCHFAVIGAAYFCPACGHNSAERVFDQSVAAIRATVAALPEIRSGLSDRDLASQVSLRLIESAIEDLVTAFQRYGEAAYFQLPQPSPSPKRNTFQRLADASQTWQTAGGDAFESILDSSEMDVLLRYFQQRHVLAHQDGIVDQRYIDHSGDLSYAVGQRLVIREQAVLEFAGVLEKLVAGMRLNLS